jgi:hypothetical protein
MVADFDGNGTADVAVRRGNLVLIDTAGDGNATRPRSTWDASPAPAPSWPRTSRAPGPAWAGIRVSGAATAAGSGDAGSDDGARSAAGKSTCGAVAQGRPGPPRRALRPLRGPGRGRRRSRRDAPLLRGPRSRGAGAGGDWNGDGRDDLILRRGVASSSISGWTAATPGHASAKAAEPRVLRAPGTASNQPRRGCLYVAITVAVGSVRPRPRPVARRRQVLFGCRRRGPGRRARRWPATRRLRACPSRWPWPPAILGRR